MNKLFAKLSFEECDCHPLPVFGPFKKYRCVDYLQELALPPLGVVTIDLARPYKGTRTTGVFVKAFGSLWIFSFMRTVNARS